jgi:peptidoglycan-associated lipoprotein
MMNKTILKTFMAVTVVASLGFAGGCKSKPSATGWDPMGMAAGDQLGGGFPIDGENFGFPQDGDRSIVDPVYFAYDSSQVSPEEAGKCEQVADYLRRGKGNGVIVEGHGDERGSREYNLALGERRALAVRDYLIVLGVDASAIHTKSFGEEMPDDMGHDEAAWRKNRRAVFAIY